MRATKAFKYDMPYCLHRVADNAYVVLNRYYHNIRDRGQAGDAEQPSIENVISLALSPKMAAELSWCGHEDLDNIWLYSGGCNPVRNKRHMASYLERKARLEELEVLFNYA